MTKRTKPDAIPTSRDAYAICRDYMERVASMLDGLDDASEVATVLAKMAMVGAELRKSEAAEAKAADIPPAVLLERIRKMSPTERANLLAEVTAMDRRGSVL
jgi:hypothetical protein